jgi:hypothetical protein
LILPQKLPDNQGEDDRDHQDSKSDQEPCLLSPIRQCGGVAKAADRYRCPERDGRYQYDAAKDEPANWTSSNGRIAVVKASSTCGASAQANRSYGGRRFYRHWIIPMHRYDALD